MHFMRYFTSLSLFLFFQFSFAQKIDILFVGNSFIYYWNLPQVVENMANFSGDSINCKQITIGGANLKKHWSINSSKSYNIEKYDIAIFNDHSTFPLLELDTCLKYFQFFTSFCHQNSVKPFIYGTWEYAFLEQISRAEDRSTMSILDSIAMVNNASYLPIGNAFEYAKQNYPKLSLFEDDNKHPSPIGTYLAACIIYKSVLNKTTMGLPRRFSGLDQNGNKIYYIITSKKAAEICQTIADKIVKIN